MIRAVWFLCIAATIWFALIPPSMGGVGGTSYHGVAFMILGLLTPAAFPKLPLWLIWLALLALGGGIELAQGTMGNFRQGEWEDFVTDAIAATAGVIYYRLWLYLQIVIARRNAAGKVSEDSSEDASEDLGAKDQKL